MSQEETQKWLREMMSKIIDSLGPDIDEARYEIPQSTDTIMSNQFYVLLKFNNKSKTEDEEISLMLKRKITQKDAITQLFGTDRQFHNEILFYQTYARPEDNFPRCFCVDQPRNSVIALENVNAKGYYACPYTHDVPLEYTLAAMRELGRFHGKGYAMKELQREEFFNIVNQLQDVRSRTDLNVYKEFTNKSVSHVVEYLRAHGYDADFCDRMEALFMDTFTNVMLKLKQPLEPLSTLCHGDFMICNMLFKMEDDGKYRGMLIDFALMIYTTPVVDLSTYMYLSCSNEIRKEKFPEIMRAYHNALKEYLQDAGVWNEEKYSYDVLLDNYKWGAPFGFFIASYYLKILKGYLVMNAEDIITVGIEEYANLCKQSIGDELSKILADMLLELKDMGCLAKFL